MVEVSRLLVRPDTFLPFVSYFPRTLQVSVQMHLSVKLAALSSRVSFNTDHGEKWMVLRAI